MKVSWRSFVAGLALAFGILVSPARTAEVEADTLRYDVYVEKSVLAIDLGRTRVLSLDLRSGAGSATGSMDEVFKFELPPVAAWKGLQRDKDLVWLGSLDVYDVLRARDLEGGVVSPASSCGGAIASLLVAYAEMANACSGSSVDHAECDAAIAALGQAIENLLRCFQQVE